MEEPHRYGGVKANSETKIGFKRMRGREKCRRKGKGRGTLK